MQTEHLAKKEANVPSDLRAWLTHLAGRGRLAIAREGIGLADVHLREETRRVGDIEGQMLIHGQLSQISSYLQLRIDIAVKEPNLLLLGAA